MPSSEDNPWCGGVCWSASVSSSCLGDPENDCSDNSSWRRTGELVPGISSSSPLQAGGAGGLELLSDSHSLFAADMASRNAVLCSDKKSKQ